MTPEGYHIFREYDSRDRLSSERVLDKRNGIDRTVSVSYDSAGNVIKVVRQGKGQEAWALSFGYDLKDRITHVEDCLGPVFGYVYDRNDWLKEETLPQAGGAILMKTATFILTMHMGRDCPWLTGRELSRGRTGIFLTVSCLSCVLQTEVRPDMSMGLTAW